MEQHQADQRTRDQPFECSQCSKSYKRQEHLQRHIAVHKGTRAYRCARCASTFQRSDVLGRHVKTCAGTQSRRSSVIRRACDACFKSKRACSIVPPCLNCRKRGVPCTFTAANAKQTTRPDTSTSASGEHLSLEPIPSTSTDASTAWIPLADDDLWSQFLDTSLPDLIADDLDWSLLTKGSESEKPSLGFLESFTRNTGFLDSFDCLTFEERMVAYNTFITQPMPESRADDLLLKSHEIVSLVRETVETKPRNNPVLFDWSPALETLCMDFFSPKHICLWLELYWAIWHPNVNYMHRATFNGKTSKASLVAAMCTIGALVSPNENDRDSARVWMNCVEEVVFRDDDVCYDGERSVLFPTFDRLQAIQSMYLCCLFQNWEGDEAAKSRIRRFRYSTVVAVARDIGISHARHPQYNLLDKSTFSWHWFVVREQLIRVFMWVFLLDTAFVIFNNVPPRMAIKEMKMHLACSEACFQAPTGDLCFQYLLHETACERLTLSSLTGTICKNPIPLESQVALADVGPLNLFALTSALHSIVFQTQQAFGFETQLGPVRVALENWNEIWQIYSTSYSTTAKHCPLANSRLCPDNMWRRIGFVRYTSEYWLLAKLIVDRITERARQSEIKPSGIDRGTSSDDSEVSAPTMLDSYDETSMRQVNNLIADFQKVVL